MRVKLPCFFLPRVVCVATVCCLPPRDECVFCFRCVYFFDRGARRGVTSSRFITITILIIGNCWKETWHMCTPLPNWELIGRLVWPLHKFNLCWWVNWSDSWLSKCLKVAVFVITCSNGDWKLSSFFWSFDHLTIFRNCSYCDEEARVQYLHF